MLSCSGVDDPKLLEDAIAGNFHVVLKPNDFVVRGSRQAEHSGDGGPPFILCSLLDPLLSVFGSAFLDVLRHLIRVQAPAFLLQVSIALAVRAGLLSPLLIIRGDDCRAPLSAPAPPLRH